MKKNYNSPPPTIHCSLFTTQATNVSGGIYANTTWSFLNSPYIVTDTVVVFPGVTLTIEAGVVVKFADHKYIEIRQANLIAIGTALDSITFTSNNASPTPGIWGVANTGGIWLNGNCSCTDSFIYCNVKYATIGVRQSLSSGAIIKHCNFTKNVIGFTSFGSNVDTSNFTYNTTTGINGISTNSLNYCNISNNGFGCDGLQIGNMNNCTVNYNQTGMHYIQDSKINNSTFKYNQTGINAPTYSYRIFKNCSIDSNTVGGITIGGYGDSLINCEIKYNNGNGVYAQYGSPPYLVITKCIIENNVTGVEVISSPIVIFCNKICNNSTHDLYYNVVSGSNANYSNNYWCSTDSTTIASHIYDGYDNISLGLVSFMPIDTLGCYLTGCNLQLATTATNATCGTCANGSASVSVSNGFAPYTFTWNTAPLQTTQTAHNLLPGTYTVCVVDANGCTACHSVTIDSVNCSTFNIVASHVNATCSTCADGTATITASGGTSPYSYTWYTTPMQHTATATGLLAGTYSVCVLDAGGCVLCDSIIIATGYCSAHFNLSPDTIPHHYLATNMASGVAPLTYDWSWGDASPDDYTPFPSHTYAAAGLYTICLTIHDAVGCGDQYCNSFYLQHTTNTMVYVNVIGNNLTTNIQQNNLGNHSSIYPNPNDGNFTIQLQVPNYELGIMDVFGRKVYAKQITNSQGKEDISLPLSKGIYFYEIRTPEGRMEKGKILFN